MRDAWPRERGLIRVSFSQTSRDNSTNRRIIDFIGKPHMLHLLESLDDLELPIYIASIFDLNFDLRINGRRDARQISTYRSQVEPAKSPGVEAVAPKSTHYRSGVDSNDSS